jgi:hypothetical protein
MLLFNYYFLKFHQVSRFRADYEQFDSITDWLVKELACENKGTDALKDSYCNKLKLKFGTLKKYNFFS